MKKPYKCQLLRVIGFSPNSPFSSFQSVAIWRTQCTLAQSQIEDPYLRGIFGFLAADSENYDVVLVGKRPS